RLGAGQIFFLLAALGLVARAAFHLAARVLDLEGVLQSQLRRVVDLLRLGGPPTLPSSEIATSFWASTANSMGSSCSTSLTKPLTSSWTASSWLRPRCIT